MLTFSKQIIWAIRYENTMNHLIVFINLLMNFFCLEMSNHSASFVDDRLQSISILKEQSIIPTVCTLVLTKELKWTTKAQQKQLISKQKVSRTCELFIFLNFSISVFALLQDLKAGILFYRGGSQSLMSQIPGPCPPPTTNFDLIGLGQDLRICMFIMQLQIILIQVIPTDQIWEIEGEWTKLLHNLCSTRSC